MLAHATPGVEWACSENGYARSVAVPGASGAVAIEPTRTMRSLRIELVLDREPDAAGISWARRRISHLLDSRAPLDSVRRVLVSDRDLRPLIRDCPGLRIPGCWDPFELAIRTIIGQQVSLGGANTLAGRLVARLGEPLAERLWPSRWAVVRGSEGARRRFPTPERLADASLTGIGLTGSRSLAIQHFARSVCDQTLSLESRPDRAAWLSHRGIGPWTIEYVSMRGYHAGDAFPSSDLALRKALVDSGESERELVTRAEAWRPYRAYAAMHLWRHYLRRTMPKRGANESMQGRQR